MLPAVMTPPRTPRKHTDIIRDLVPLKGRRVLDVGCGDGALIRFLAREGAKATGLEIGAAVLATARSHPREADEAYVEGAGQNLPFADGSFDLVIYLNAFHHV
ncbi:MAG: class I SAM-dependent methyltransferase, partial [Rhodospirillales bacterium]|nr:class I SAM-dependent methyltransferase [Rhodospirillales bacterium]